MVFAIPFAVLLVALVVGSLVAFSLWGGGGVTEDEADEEAFTTGARLRSRRSEAAWPGWNGGHGGHRPTDGRRHAA